MATLQSTDIQGNLTVDNALTVNDNIVVNGDLSVSSGNQLTVTSGTPAPYVVERIGDAPSDTHYIIICNSAPGNATAAGTFFGARSSGNTNSGMVDLHISNSSGGPSANIFVRALQGAASNYILRTLTYQGVSRVAIQVPAGGVTRWNTTGLYWEGFKHPDINFAFAGASEVSNVANFSSNHGTSSHMSAAFSAPSKNFLIDHPLGNNMQLRHGSIEAPRYDLIYRGDVQIINGRATVDIDQASSMTPGTFDSFTTFARVTSLQNQTGFCSVKASLIANGKFEIHAESSDCNDLVHWTVMAERKDIDPLVVEDLTNIDNNDTELE